MASANNPSQGQTYKGDSISVGDLADAGYTMVGNQAYDSDGNPVSIAPRQSVTSKGMLRRLIIPVLLLALGGFLMSKKKTRIAGYVVGGLGAVTGVMSFIKK